MLESDVASSDAASITDSVPLSWPSVPLLPAALMLARLARAGSVGVRARARALSVRDEERRPVATSAAGYQPVGTRPTRLLAAAPATGRTPRPRSRRPRRRRAASRRPRARARSACCPRPDPPAAGRAARRRVAGFVSITAMRSVLADATKSRVPVRLSSSADGCRPAGIQSAGDEPVAVAA